MFVRQVAARVARCRAASCVELVAAKDWSGLAAKLEKQPEETVDADALSKALWSICAARKVSLAYQFFLHTVKEPQERHYTALIEGALRVNKPILAANLYYQSELLGVELDAAAYNELLTGLLKAGAGLRNIRHVYGQMTRLALYPSAFTCARLLKLCVKMSDWTFATEILTLMQAHKLEYPRKLLDSSLTVPKQGEDFALFQKLWLSLSNSDDDTEAYQSSHEEPMKIKVQARRIKDMDSLHLIMTPGSMEREDVSSESEAEEEDSSHSEDSD